MDTIMTVEINGSTDDIKEVKKIIENVENSLSVTLSYSAVHSLNALKSFEFDKEYVDLVSRCVEISTLTDGFFDITVFPLVKLWGFDNKTYRVPDESEITENLTKVGYEKINLTGKTVTLSQSAEIDFGGIAKGYCTDKIVSYLKSRGVKNGILNLGGNVYVLGLKDNGEEYKVGIAHPNGADCFGLLSVHDKAVVTSGQYQRNFSYNGKQYGHIIDPHTGYPVENGFRSVTIIGEDGTLCDALSTAVFCMGELAFPFITANRVSCVILTDDSVYVSEDIKDSFSIAAEHSYLALKVIEW